MNIPSLLQSSVNPEEVSLTVTSIGKAVAGLIVFLGMIGVVDPAIAGQTWGNFVSEVVTAVPVAYGVWHSGQAVWGIIRKISVRISTLFTNTPTAQQ
jgi:hypothetical protein